MDSAVDNCWSVLTEGEVLPFSIRLSVLIFSPLISERVFREKSLSLRINRNRFPTLSSIVNVSLTGILVR